MEEVLAARASVGMARATTAPRRRVRGRFLAAGALAVLSVATLIALVVVPNQRGDGTVNLATGPGAAAVHAAYRATAATGTARGSLTVTAGGRTVTATGVGDFEGGSAQADINLAEGAGGQPTAITVVRTAGATYAKLPAGLNPLGTNKPWVSVDAATLARLTQMAVGDLGAQVTGAPLDALSYLKAVSGDVQVVGPDTTRGDATTHYRGSIDPQKVAEQLPPAVRADANRAAAQAGQNIPADLWIDGQGRLRKLVLSADASSSSKPQGAPAEAVGPATATLELWDFGTPVEATAPPADQVVDVGGLLGGFLSGARKP
jgi:hypothetical protein